ncbi:MAG: radical SAM family heme chaperone HemW [Chloroflexi bacterium]|nr:radical SAM family heme chaperone HemW [Chloroflexota bacterium]
MDPRALTFEAPAKGTGPETAIGLYVHIPFCETKCPYCDFNTYAGIEPLIPEYVLALRKELRIWGSLLGRPTVGTVFLGGGTPSYLPAEALESVVGTMRDAFELLPDAEVTMEANPDDCSPAKLADARGAGLNRISIGVQSLDDRLLKSLGRRHDAAQAVSAARTARSAGFKNVNLDLMFGLPDQSLAHWEDSLAGVMELAPDHVSLYALTLEPNTPLAAWVKAGKVADPDPDLAADMYEHAEDVMASAGFRHYEISNWARPGFESRHNLVYWTNGPYLGVGPGAHSHLRATRFANLKSPREYIRRMREIALTPILSRRERGDFLPAQTWGIGSHDPVERNEEGDFLLSPTSEIAPSRAPSPGGRGGRGGGDVADPALRQAQGASPARTFLSPTWESNEERGVTPPATAFMAQAGIVESAERVSPAQEMSETMMMGLRLDTGISARAFQARFGRTLDEAFGDIIAGLVDLELLARDPSGIRLTRRGRLLGNEVFSRFVGVPGAA